MTLVIRDSKGRIKAEITINDVNEPGPNVGQQLQILAAELYLARLKTQPATLQKAG